MKNAAVTTHETFVSPATEIIEEAACGRMVILVDDEDRENEGDLVLAAEFCTPEAINFMATHGRGLICLALTRERCHTLSLPLMAQGNGSRLETAFTVSIEAVHGVTTGISAADRSRTVKAAIDDDTTSRDLRTPGHVFPLMARDGGVLVRAGHTEAAIDIPRLAGLKQAGVICEIMNEDGTMARLADLLPFAQRHGLKIGTIADLIKYRLSHDRLISRVSEGSFHSSHGGNFNLYVYKSLIDGVEHVALVKGDVSTGGPVLTRVHALDIVTDVLGIASGGPVQHAMLEIAKEGRGVVVLLRQPQASGLSQTLADTSEKGIDLRIFGVGAQILCDLGVRDIILLSNSHRDVVGLEGYELEVVECRPFVKTSS